MKLRNKRNGEIRKAEAREDGIYLWHEETEQWYKYDLNLLAESWEYYIEPKEPLIKDEKVRKAVRAWAEAENIPKNETVCYSVCDHCFGWYGSEILFSEKINDLEDKEYSILELCGEDNK